MELTILGTGHAMATNCYNTCFALKDKDDYFLVDTGGGNGILKQLKSADIPIEKIRDIFISHIHIDHILGCVWIVRSMCKRFFKNEITEPLKIYGNENVINVLKNMLYMLLPPDFKILLNDKFIFIELKDQDCLNVLNRKIMFFDLNAKKVEQFGFTLWLDKMNKFTFIGDEVCSSETEKYVMESKWLFADAYMCGEKAEIYDPISKHNHSSVKYISKLSSKLNVQNLILSHTMDDDLKNRKKDFIFDAKKYYNGNVYVPNDLEKIEIGE